MARRILPLKERFESKVDRNGPAPEYRPDLGPCWLWTAGIDKDGYGRFAQNEPRGVVGAHRVAYRLFRGPIPAGLELDHLCRVRCCVNPDHLEPVTRLVNHRRGLQRMTAGAHQKVKTHCPAGHPLSGENLDGRNLRRGYRVCKICVNESYRRYRRRKMAGLV